GSHRRRVGTEPGSRPGRDSETAAGRITLSAAVRAAEPGGPLMENPAVISLGSVNVDIQVRTDHWPGPSETLIARDFLMIGGGKAANVAYLARRLGADARALAHVGDDVLADRALEPLQR